MIAEKVECPECGEKTLYKIWCGIEPQTCSSCGHKPVNRKITY